MGLDTTAEVECATQRIRHKTEVWPIRWFVTVYELAIPNQISKLWEIVKAKCRILKHKNYVVEIGHFEACAQGDDAFADS